MSVLSAVWDGELHYLEPDTMELFGDLGCTLVIDDWEESDDDPKLDPFETPTLVPVLRETGQPKSDKLEAAFPLARTEQSWGSLSIILSAFARVAGVEKKQYQLTWPGQGAIKDRVRWSFQTNEHITERM